MDRSQLGSLRPTCPAATPIAGPPDRGPSVLCGVWLLEMREGRLPDAEQGVLITARSDPSTLGQLCCGEGIPGSPQSYHSCPVWREERERKWDARRTLESVWDDDGDGLFELARESSGPAGLDPDVHRDQFFDDVLAA